MKILPQPQVFLKVHYFTQKFNKRDEEQSIDNQSNNAFNGLKMIVRKDDECEHK